MGSEKLLVVSVGTGSMEPRLDADAVMKMPAAALAMRSLASLMDDASALNETILQWMSSRSTFRVIDREIGDLRDDHLGPDGALISYVRYDVQLDQRWLKENLELEYTPRKLSKIDQMDRPDNMDDLESIGRAAGKRLVEDDHFPGVFDSVSTT
jgi:hypothetical protein